MIGKAFSTLDAKEIETLIVNAGRAAQSIAHRNKVPYSVTRNGRLLLVMPDGRELDITGKSPEEIVW